MATRSELEAALKAGCRVNVNGQSVRHVKELPPELAPTDTNPDPTPLVGVVMYDAQGNLTREGMEHTIRTGGSVLHNGEFVTDVDLLPTSADLARGDATRTKQERDRLLSQQAAIQGELAKLDAPPVPQAQPVNAPKASNLPREPGSGSQVTTQHAIPKEALPHARETVDVDEARRQIAADEQRDHGQHGGRRGR